MLYTFEKPVGRKNNNIHAIMYDLTSKVHKNALSETWSVYMEWLIFCKYS